MMSSIKLNYLHFAFSKFYNDAGEVLDGELAKNSEYETNKVNMDAIVQKYTAALSNALNGGGEKAKLKHKARGKLLARERIDCLLDYGSPFLELSTLAGNDMYGDVPSAGIVSGIGKICGVTCVIAANDATVKGGTVCFALFIKIELNYSV